MAINEAQLLNAIDKVTNYKVELGHAQNLQAAGFTVPNTKSKDFLGVFNSASREAMSALELFDPARLESLGEILLNASRNIADVERAKLEGKPIPMW